MDAHFSRWLRREIENTGMSFIDFAAQCGVSIESLMRWLRCDPPRIRGYNVARLAKALGIPREEIDERLAADQHKCTAA